MIMTLNVQDSGRVRYVKRPGVVLEAGCVVARLELDDASKVHAVCNVVPAALGHAVCNTWSLQLWLAQKLLLCHPVEGEQTGVSLFLGLSVSAVGTLSPGDNVIGSPWQPCPCLLQSLYSSSPCLEQSPGSSQDPRAEELLPVTLGLPFYPWHLQESTQASTWKDLPQAVPRLIPTLT